MLRDLLNLNSSQGFAKYFSTIQYMQYNIFIQIPSIRHTLRKEMMVPYMEVLDFAASETTSTEGMTFMYD